MNISPPPKVAVLLLILPEELIVEVLSFFEVKSLMLMKCVCKSWKTLFSDPIFHKLHLKNQSTRTTHLATLASKFNGWGDCRAIPISRLLETTSNSIILSDPYCTYKDACNVVGSCNGLACLQSLSCAVKYMEYSFCFWNPATRLKSETLVSFLFYGKENSSCNFAFGYDNSTDTYKVVSICLKFDADLITTVLRVFTLGDNVWRDIDCFPVVLVCYRDYLFAEDGVYLNNSINWFVRHRYFCHLKNLNIEQFVIISLDLGTETCTQLLLPRFCHEVNLSELMGCLCVHYEFKKTDFVIMANEGIWS